MNNSDLLLRCKRARTFFFGGNCDLLVAQQEHERTNATGMSRVWKNKCPQLEFRRYLFDDIRTPPTFFLFLPHAPAAKLLTGRVELTKRVRVSHLVSLPVSWRSVPQSFLLCFSIFA